MFLARETRHLFLVLSGITILMGGWTLANSEDEQLSTSPATLEAANLYSRGNLSGAAEALRRGLADEPDNAQLRFMLANALYRLEDWAGAIEHYSIAAQLRPGHTDTHLNLGYAWFHAGGFDQAVVAWQKAVRQTPQDALVHLSLAIGLHAQNDVAGAQRRVARAVALEPRWQERVAVDIRWTPGMLESISALTMSLQQ